MGELARSPTRCRWQLKLSRLSDRRGASTSPRRKTATLSRSSSTKHTMDSANHAYDTHPMSKMSPRRPHTCMTAVLVIMRDNS
eukprot:5152633-Pyramimonas_sp.AAC.1